MLAEKPRILHVETGWLVASETAEPVNVIDYSIYRGFPKWLRWIERLLRLDFYLAWRVKKMEQQFDIIYAKSEKVGIPLSFMRLRRPLVVVAHHLESPLKARFAKMTGIARNWAGIGYISNESKDFFANRLGVATERLFQCESAKYLDSVVPEEVTTDGPVMSLGVAKRDYNTLIAALTELPGCRTDLYVSSKFGDTLHNTIEVPPPPWVRLKKFVSEEELVARYRQARFVIVSLEETTHNGAGVNVVLEAGAFGKAVIATNTGGMPTFVRDGETGILVPPYDVEAMQAAVEKLCSQPDLAHQMGQAGRCYVEQYFNPRDVDARIAALLDAIHRNGVPDL